MISVGQTFDKQKYFLPTFLSSPKPDQFNEVSTIKKAEAFGNSFLSLFSLSEKMFFQSCLFQPNCVLHSIIATTSVSPRHIEISGRIELRFLLFVFLNKPQEAFYKF